MTAAAACGGSGAWVTVDQKCGRRWASAPQSHTARRRQQLEIAGPRMVERNITEAEWF